MYESRNDPPVQRLCLYALEISSTHASQLDACISDCYCVPRGSRTHRRSASACMRSSSSSCDTVKPSSSEPQSWATRTCEGGGGDEEGGRRGLGGGGGGAGAVVAGFPVRVGLERVCHEPGALGYYLTSSPT